MNNKVAVITGAGRGIGFAIANELAEMGYSLGLTACSGESVESAAKKLSEQYPGIGIITGAFNVADKDKPEEFIKKVNEEIGNVSVLVNNAGYYKSGTSELTIDEAIKSVEINYLAAVRFVSAALPFMKKNGKGYIFNIASLCGVESFSDTGIYSGSKHALVGYSSALTQELAPLGIKVTAICPSWVNTQGAADAPMKPEEMIQTEDIAFTIRYLLGLGPAASIRELIIRC
ncbi:MAG: SDR family NAD(P)-dependent oxidoreductase [Bacteroidetes bacterium]|nr:SDR family NAD(P)-dependent oxidoreductase [Bacteroidota bacterium]